MQKKMNKFRTLAKFNLDGKVAVITGGAGIIGSSIAKGLGEAGCKIAICDIVNTDSINKKLKKFGIDANGYYIDVLDRAKIEQCYSKVLKDFSRIDILLNAAGGNQKEATTSKDKSFFDLEIKHLRRVIDLNLFGGAILPSQVFGKHMVSNKYGGSIINISSMSAYHPLTKTLGYSAAKAAVSNFTEWLAVHFAQEYNKKIKVNAIAPGFFSTNQNKYLLYNKDGKLSDRGKTIINRTPMARFGDPEDLIGVCIWLASDHSNFVTGTVIPIDGGFNAFSGV